MKKLILVVDDSPDLLELLQIALNFFGYEVLAAKNGLEAVELATLKAPDLIVMDMFMPVMNGIEATSRIRQNPKTRHIPIVAATANAAPGSEERFLAAGCDYYISKPFTYQSLAAVINRLLERSKKQDMSDESPRP